MSVEINNTKSRFFCREKNKYKGFCSFLPLFVARKLSDKVLLCKGKSKKGKHIRS